MISLGVHTSAMFELQVNSRFLNIASPLASIHWFADIQMAVCLNSLLTCTRVCYRSTT